MINLSKYDIISFDTETDGLVYPVNKAFGVSIATPNDGSYYWDLREHPQAVDRLNREFKKFKGVVVCHNASFDYKMALSAGIQLPLERIVDTVIQACCINEQLLSYSLDALAKKYLGKEKVEEIYEQLAKLFGGRATRNVQMPNISRAPSNVVAPYAKVDAELTLELYQWQMKEIAKQGIQDIVLFEMMRMPMFIEAEIRGIRVDIKAAEETMHAMTPHINDLQKEVNKLAGCELNVSSSPQVKEIFAPVQTPTGWVTKDGVPIGMTDNGGPSIDAEVLKSMDDPLAKGIVELRSLLKTRDTFLGKHILEHQHNGRVYPNINQSKGEDGGTGTGRFSYTNPAMQQIPNRNKEIAKKIKSCFLPEEGQVWLDSDMNSFEVRVFAHLVARYNESVSKAYYENPMLDLHQWVADLMGIPRNPRPEGGANAKQLNLSMIFNSGNGAIAEKVGLPWEFAEFVDKRTGQKVVYKKAGAEAEAMISKYHNKVPGVKKLAEEAKRVAEQRGYVKTFTGRRLRFPNPRYSYKASGLLIQATSADLNKQNWSLISRALGKDGVLLLNTHDSYSMSVDPDWKPVWARVKEAVETDRKLAVPLILDLKGCGTNWWNAIAGDK